jgi:nitrous oxide reductase accessory protein NosL
MRPLVVPLLFAVLLAGCDAKVTTAPAEPEKVEKNTTIVNNPPAEEKKVEKNTTIVNPPSQTTEEKKTTTTTTQ